MWFTQRSARISIRFSGLLTAFKKRPTFFRQTVSILLFVCTKHKYWQNLPVPRTDTQPFKLVKLICNRLISPEQFVLSHTYKLCFCSLHLLVRITSTARYSTCHSHVSNNSAHLFMHMHYSHRLMQFLHLTLPKHYINAGPPARVDRLVSLTRALLISYDLTDVSYRFENTKQSALFFMYTNK